MIFKGILGDPSVVTHGTTHTTAQSQMPDLSALAGGSLEDWGRRSGSTNYIHGQRPFTHAA